jgi:hypothetical protein
MVSFRTNTIWAPPRAASVGKSFALLSANPEPTVKKLKEKRTNQRRMTSGGIFRMCEYQRSYQRPGRGPYESTRRDHVKMEESGGTVRLTVTNRMGCFIRFVCITVPKGPDSTETRENNKRATDVNLITSIKASSKLLGLPAQVRSDLR